MSETLRSVLIWTTVFLAFELPAHYGLVPWYTLSSTVWKGEAYWWPIAVLVLVFTFVLLGHLELHWSVRYLIAVSAAAGALIVSHALEHVL